MRRLFISYARENKPDVEALARRMKENGETAATICKTLGIGRTRSSTCRSR
ncbi:hypothetical protein [Mycobacterium sp.]|uniref:hypothetical protein n=1 Tax=Mycobacterium sp. TaxID=1785 RepID=UPI003C76D789